MHRGNNRRRLFSYSTDYRTVLRYILDALSRVDFAVRVHAIALMANHLHLIVTPETEPALSEFVKSFAQRYTNYRNRAKDGSGKLFEERFKSKAILDDVYLATCHGYLELNPVRAHIVDAPDTYRWTSYRHLARTGTSEPLFDDLITPSAWYLDLGSNAQARASEFARWVEAWHIFGSAPKDVERWRQVESYSDPYTRRLERPDRSRARESRPKYQTARLGQ